MWGRFFSNCCYFFWTKKRCSVSTDLKRPWIMVGLMEPFMKKVWCNFRGEKSCVQFYWTKKTRTLPKKTPVWISELSIWTIVALHCSAGQILVQSFTKIHDPLKMVTYLLHTIRSVIAFWAGKKPQTVSQNFSNTHQNSYPSVRLSMYPGCNSLYLVYSLIYCVAFILLRNWFPHGLWCAKKGSESRNKWRSRTRTSRAKTRSLVGERR